MECQHGHQIETWRGRDVCINCGVEDTTYKEKVVEKMQTDTHDHLCPTTNKHLVSPVTCTFCQIIRKAREEERNSFIPIQ